jgi:hypothetical protein
MSKNKKNIFCACNQAEKKWVCHSCPNYKVLNPAATFLFYSWPRKLLKKEFERFQFTETSK